MSARSLTRPALLSFWIAGVALAATAQHLPPSPSREPAPNAPAATPIVRPTVDQPPVDLSRFRGVWCGTPQVVQADEGAVAGGSAGDCASLFTTPFPGGLDPYGTAFVKYRIPVVFHVIHNGAGEYPNGQLSVARVQSQIAQLNADFLSAAGSPGDPGPDVQIEFYLNTTVDGDGIMYHNNAAWFNGTDTSWAATTVDAHNNLNMFSFDLPGSLAGLSNIPQGCSGCAAVGSGADVVMLDFLFIGNPSLLLAPYNNGRIVSHEVGHYLGLYHTFQGGCGVDANPGCYSTGDAICDTPGQAAQTNGCPAVIDTCASGGVDPIHNYMDYSEPPCWTGFSTEQVRRMRCTLENWRPSLGEPVFNCPIPPSFGGNFTATPFVLFSDVATSGSTVFVAGPTCPPGLSDGGGEGANMYAGTGITHQGNEVAYKILHGGGDLRLDLTGLSQDLDLMLLGSAGTPASTLQFSGTGGTASESIVRAGAAPGVYYAVVDTWGGLNPGCPFTLTYRGDPVGYNLDVNSTTGGTAAGPPSNSFGGAAAQAGMWIPLSDSALSANLAVAGGFVTSATATRSDASGGTFSNDNPNTSGDHQLLLDDGQAVPLTGATFTFAHLPAGRYRVYTYAIAPDSGAMFTHIGVTGSPDAAVDVGGPMPVNSFTNGVTHTSHRVTIAAGGNVVVNISQALGSQYLTVNGFQITPRPACGSDINGSDNVDVSDLLAVITAWGACAGACPPHCAPDIAPPNTGDCQVNVSDLLAVITAWGACPG